MEIVSNLIIAGCEQFCNRLYGMIDDIIPGVEQISYAPRPEMLFSRLKEKKYQVLFVEDGFIRRLPSGVSLVKIKTTAPALKIILVAPGKKTKEVGEADYVLPPKFSKKELAAILLKQETTQPAGKEAALNLIRDALKDGFHIRYLQVFNGIVSGWQNKEIGDYINIGERTVETYREGLYNVSGFKGVAKITLYGLRKGWIDEYGNKFLDDELLKDFILKKIC